MLESKSGFLNYWSQKKSKSIKCGFAGFYRKLEVYFKPQNSQIDEIWICTILLEGFSRENEVGG